MYPLNARTSSAGDGLKEVLIRLFDFRLQRVLLRFGKGSAGREDSGILAAGENRSLDAEPPQQTREIKLSSEDANRAHDRMGCGPDFLGAQCRKVTAARDHLVGVCEQRLLRRGAPHFVQ